ncbi:sigma-70 family RNA polymerase sigma factor [Aeoliella sp.]|uniref:sigma-70 family RNA polymerase sigma factor n=1 Tax=Aeoliella sp. TaxID=2795800 RepID=UPI003CCB7C0D
METNDSIDRDRRFVDLLTSHQRDLYVYTHTLMAGDSATADVVQDANVDLWAHKDKYDPSRPFLPWALRFAYHRVLAYRKTRSRSRLLLSDEFVSSLADSMERNPLEADGRLAALTRCLENLRDEQRTLLRERYTCGVSVKGLATRMNATADQISSRLYRLRKDLGQCIERRMAAEGA